MASMILRTAAQRLGINIQAAGGFASAAGVVAATVGLTTTLASSTATTDVGDHSKAYYNNKNNSNTNEKDGFWWNSSMRPSLSSTLWNPTPSISYCSMEAADHFKNNNTNIKTSPSANLQRRMTAIGHFSLLSETIQNPSINIFVLTLQSSVHKPWTSRRFGDLWEASQMPHRHGRFHFVVQDETRGHFGPVSNSSGNNDNGETDVDVFVSESLPPVNQRAEILQRIRSAQTERWDLGEKLWELDVIPWTKKGALGTVDAPLSNDEDAAMDQDEEDVDDDTDTKNTAKQNKNDEMGESLLLLRGHHALSDGASMAAALMDLSDEADDLRARVQIEIEKRLGPASTPWWKRWYQKLLFFLWLATGSWAAAWYHFKLYLANWWLELRHGGNPWHRLEQEAASTADSEQQQGPLRSVSFATVAEVGQAKWVAQTLAGKRATLNDVFCSAVSRAVQKQLQWHRQRLEATEGLSGELLTPNQLARLSRIHVAVPVHLKGGVIFPGESVGNSIGAFCVALPGERPDLTATQRLQHTHQELFRTKRRPTAFLSHYIAKLSTQILPTSWVSHMFARANTGASCVVTNIRGPEHPIHLEGDRVESAFGFVPLAPGIPIGVAVGSYNGKVQVTVTAQPWAVPDADRFLTWIMEEYVDLVQAAAEKDLAK